MPKMNEQSPSETNESHESFVLKLKTKWSECKDKLSSLNTSIEELQKRVQTLIYVEKIALSDTLSLHEKSLKYIESIDRNTSNMELYADFNSACSDIKKQISDINNLVEKHRESIAEKFAQTQSLTREMSLHRRTLDVIEKEPRSIINRTRTFEEIVASKYGYDSGIMWFKSMLTEGEVMSKCGTCKRGFIACSFNGTYFGYDCHCICIPD